MTTNNKAYSVLASFYDALMSGYPYDKVIAKLTDTLSGKGMDLGTGSGRIAIALAKRGLNVIGVDKSTEMLEVAQSNARREGVKVVFACSDCENLELTKVDFVTATCDVVNYLSSKTAVVKFFKKVYDALRDGGNFVFDVSSSYKLRSMAKEQYFEDRDDVTYLWCNSLKGDKLIMDVAFFLPNGEVYRRVDERHTMLVLDCEFLTDTLTEIGFDVKVYGHNLSKYTEKSDRIFFFARKNG